MIAVVQSGPIWNILERPIRLIQRFWLVVSFSGRVDHFQLGLESQSPRFG